MAERILVPLDGSKHSETVLTWVRKFAAQAPVELLLVQVLQPVVAYAVGTMGTEPPMVIDPQAERAQAQAYLERIDGGKANVVARLVRDGIPSDEILAVVAEQHVDLIAMSTHGRTGLGHLLLGSVTEDVIRRAGIPVLVLRPLPTNTRA